MHDYHFQIDFPIIRLYAEETFYNEISYNLIRSFFGYCRRCCLSPAFAAFASSPIIRINYYYRISFGNVIITDESTFKFAFPRRPNIDKLFWQIKALMLTENR